MQILLGINREYFPSARHLNLRAVKLFAALQAAPDNRFKGLSREQLIARHLQIALQFLKVALPNGRPQTVLRQPGIHLFGS